MARLNGARLLMLEKEKDKVVREVPVRTGQVQIGSNPMLNMIRLNSDGVEPIHCKIFVKNEKVFIANYSTANPISVDNSVVPKRAVLHDGSILEICGTRFRWKFDESKLAAVNRPEKAKKTEQTPTSSKYGNRRRTTMVRKKQPVVTATAGGSGKKPAAKKNAQQNRTPTYTLPKNHKQLLRNIRKRFTVHNIITRNNSDDVADEEDADCEESAIPEVAESSKPVTPTKSSSTTSSAANTPFYTPEPEKENSVPVTKTPKTPMLQLENSAMMILSYTPAIGSRSKANIQKTPLSVAKSAQRLNYLTPKNENVSTNATPLKSKAGNSMYLIDLTTPNSGHSSFVCSPMLDTTASSIGSPKLRLIDLTTPSPKKAKTPASVLKSTQQKTLLKSALKNASKTPRTALRTGTGTPVTPKAVPKISLNDTPTKSAVSTRSNKTPASSTKGSSIRSKLETPVSSKKVDSARKQMTPVTSTVSQSESTPQKEISIMTTDELFDTLVGRQSNVKTYERKSTSPKKTPCPLVVAEGTTELPKTDIDIWVESVVAAVTSPESVSMDAIIRKPNQTTQVRSSQYSDITPHESFAEATSTSEVVDTQPEVGPVSSLDELDNITDGPTIPNSGRRSDTPLASKIARSLGNKRQTIGNFFTNIFGKLTVSPVTRISIADDSLNQSEDQKPSDQGDDSDGSEEVYHDSETDHGLDVPQPTNESVASSPKLRQSLRDTRKFIGNAWTSLNTSRPQLDNTAEIDESLLLSDTYNETKTDAGNNTVDEDYDLTDLGSRPATAQLPVTSPAKTPTLRQSVKLTEAFDISPLATPLESTPNKTGLQVLDRNTTGSFVISPDATLPGTPVSRRSQASTPNVTSGFTPSKRSTRRQTGSTDISSVVPTEDTENVEDIAHSQSASDQLLQSVRKSPNQSLNVDVAKEQVTEHIFVEMSQDVVAATVSKIMANEKGEEHEAEEPYQSVPEDICQESLGEVTTGEPTNKDDSIALETSEMEPLEVSGGYESDVHPATPSSKDFVSSKRATRNSIATLKVVTPQSSISAVKVPMSESKLPLRGLQKAIVGTSEESPTKQSEDTFREVDLLKQSNESIKPTVAVGEQSSVEQSTNIDKSITACDDQDEVTHVEAALNEITTLDEVPPSEDNVSATPELSQTVDPVPETVDELDGNDSIANLDISNLNAARRRTRKSLASMTITPKATVAPLNKVPMSESKLPLRVLRKTMVETSEKSSETPSGKDSVGNFDLLEDSYIGKGDIADVGNGSVVEKSIEINKSMTACNDKVANVESESNEFIPCSEATLPEDDHVTPTVKSSQASVEPDLSTVEDTVVFDSSVNLETINLNVSARRSTRKSLATTTITPKAIAAPLSKVPMSESKLPLRRLRATETSILEETVEQSPCLEENSNAADPDQAPAFLEILEINQSSTPVPASPGRPSRSSARSTPQKLSNTTISKSTPSGTAPLLKRVLQKVIKDSATKTVVVQSPKPNDSAADTSLHLDQLYRTPTLRVTHGKVIATSTPNIVDESLKLNELYETPTRVTRGNAQLEKGNGDESLASSSLHLDNLYGSPAHSVASREDSEIAVEDKLELSTVDNTLNLQDLYTTPAQTLRDVSQFSEVPETHYENASSNVEADVSLNLLKAPTQINIEQPTANNAKPPMEVDTNLHKTPARSVTSSDVTRESAKENVDMSLNLQELYKTPTQQTQEPISTGAADEGHTLQQLHKTRHSVVVKGSLKSVSEPQSSADMSLNLQELYKTPARPIRSTAVTSTSKHTPKDAGNADRCMVIESQPDMSLNLQDLYKTPTGTVRTVQQSVVKNIATPKKDVAQADASLNLQEMYKTPSSTNKSTPKGAATADLLKVKEPQSNTSLNLHDLYKTPARSTRNATVASTSKGTSKAAVDGNKAAELQPDVSLNLQELYKTPARTLRTNTQQSAAKNMATPMGEDADASLPNLQQLYKTPARSTRSAALASTSKSTPKTAEESKPDVSLNLQELYKTPARTLRGVSKLTPANTSKLNTPVVEPVQREPEADVSLNLDQLYKTPARQVRGTTQMSAIKHVKVSEVTPLKTVEKAGMDVTPTVESSKIQRTPIANVSESEANMTLNLEQMYKTPARQLSAKEKVEADTTLNLDQLYKTPAHSLSGVTQLTAAKASTPATDAKSEAEENLNLQELYQTPARMLQSDKSQSSAIKESNQTPALTQHNTTTQAEESNLNVDLLFKTPARTTRARLPRSSAKAAATDATPVTNTPSCTPRSTSSRLTSATPAASTSRVELSMAESELVSSIVDEESMNMGSESDGLATGKAISSTPFNPRTRKSTLVATVGMMSPLNSSGDGTMTMHTEAIGITTIQDMSTAADSTTVDQMQTMAGVFVAAQSRLLYDESGLQSTMLGDPLQVTNVLESPAGTQSEDSTCVEAITATQQDKTTEDAAVESLLEQNETLTKTTSSAKATESRDCSVSTTTAAEEVEDTIQELPKADASLVLNQSNSSPARTLRNSRFVAETPVAKSTFVSKCTESDVSICLNIPETPARMSEKLTSPNTPSAVFEPKSPPVQSPAVSPKVSSTLASSAKKSTSVTPKTIPARLSFTSLESKSSSTSKQRRSVTVKNSVTEQELATVPDKVTEITNEPGSPSVECKSIENVPDNSVSADPADATALKNSVTNLSVPESSTVEEAINAVTLEVACTTENQTVAAEPYLDANNSLGVDEALLQQIRERVTTLERELEEMDNGTHGSSTFLERSDDSQEVSEVEIKLDDKTPKPKKRQLYTKVVPDDNTPERRESIGDLRSTSSKHVYVETASSDKKADTSSEVDESKKVEIPVKVLPSRASRRKITTLSEEALAGASPELKFVKPKPPKVVPSEVTPSINTSSGNTSETEVSDQETSLGRRKVAFNDHIQVKEINSPAFVGEIIKKTSQRGRGRNTKKVVTVTVDQTLTQSIKPATKRGKPVEPEELPAEEVEHGKVEVTQQASDKVETVELEQKPDQIAEELSEVIAPIDEPAAKRSRSKKASAAKRTTSKAKVEDPTSTSDEPEVAKPTAKRSRRGAKTEATEVIETTKDATDETNDEVEQISDVPDSEPFANTEEEVLEDTKEPSEQSEGVLEVPVDEPVIKRNRSKKAPAAKRTVSRTKIEDHASTSDGKPDEPEIAKPTAKRARRGAKINTADVAETVVEAADEDTNVSKEQAVNVQASCNEGKSSEPEAAAIKPTAKRLRRGANADASDVTGAKDAEKPAEVEQSVNEPISKRIRHAPETKTDPAVEKPIDDKEDRIKERDQIDEVQSATKAPSRSRRGKKQVETSVKTVDVPAGPEVASPVKVQEIEQASKTLEVKSRSRRGANTKETHAEVIVHTESSEDAPAEVKESTDSTMEFAGGKKEDIETMVENDGAVENAAVGALKPEQTAEKTHETMESKEETKPRSGRSGTKAKITEKRAPANEDTPVEIQNTKQAKSRRAAKKQPTEDESVAKETEDVSSSATDSHEEKSSAQIRSAAKKTTRKGRGAVKNTTVESATAISASLVVEKAVADSTSHEDPSVDAEVDAKSNAKRSRRGAKDESEATEAKDEPTTKRSRRAPKSSAEQVTEAHAESVDVIEEPKTTSRSRRTQKQGTDIASSAVEKSATKRTKQDESQQESTVEQQEALEAEDKPASRRGAKKKASEEESSARMPSPTLAPPAVDEQPAKRTGRQAARRAPKKANNPDPTPVEMSMNESHMVKTVLPASHTSTPLAKTAANADNEVPSATRGRRAANPVIAALIEQSTPNTRSRRGASATPTVVQVETPSTPVRRGRGAASKAKAAEDETPQPNNAESETSTNRGRKTKDKEVVEPAPVAKRARKVPSKLRDETDDDLGAKKVQPTRGRRGAKAKTEESNAADEDETVEVSAGPSEEQPKKKGRATAKRTVKKADLNEESVPVEEEAEEKKAPKSPPPKRSRKGAR